MAAILRSRVTRGPFRSLRTKDDVPRRSAVAKAGESGLTSYMGGSYTPKPGGEAGFVPARPAAPLPSAHVAQARARSARGRAWRVARQHVCGRGIERRKPFAGVRWRGRVRRGPGDGRDARGATAISSTARAAAWAACGTRCRERGGLGPAPARADLPRITSQSLPLRSRERQLRQGKVELLAVERDEARQLGNGGVEQHALGRLDVRGRLAKLPKGTSIPGTPVVGLALIPGSQGHEPIRPQPRPRAASPNWADRAHAIQEGLGLVGYRWPAPRQMPLRPPRTLRARAIPGPGAAPKPAQRGSARQTTRSSRSVVKQRPGQRRPRSALK